jgi:hypothetical protein
MSTNISFNNRFNVKTIFPELVDSNITNSKQFLEEYTNFIKQIGFKDGENYMGNSIDIAIDYRNALKSSNPIQNLINFFVELNSKLKTQQNDFKDYWIKKFNSSVDEVKNVVLEKLSDQQNFFAPVSDSIGSLYNLTPNSDDSTLLVSDLNSDKGFSTTLPSSLKNKISKAVLENSAELSIFTNRVFRNNLVQIQKSTYNGNLYVDSSVAHGQNLVNDLIFFNNFKRNIPNYVSELNSYFGDRYEYVIYCSNINDNIGLNLRDYDIYNIQKTPDFSYTINIEGKDQTVDILQNKYIESTSNITIGQVLGVAKLTNSNQPVDTQSINNTFLNQTNQQQFPEFVSRDTNNKSTKQQELKDSTLGLNDKLSFVSSLTDKLGVGGALELSQPFVGESITFISNTFNEAVAPVNSIFGELGGFIQNVSNTSNINAISFANPLQAVQSIESMASNLTNTLNSIPFLDFTSPSVDLGSFPQLAAIATNTNFKDLASNPLGVLELAQQVKDLVCNFQLPIIGDLDFSALLTFDFDGIEDMLKKIGNKFEKLWNDIEKFFTNLFDFNKLFKNFSSKFFECDKNKN